MSAENRNIFELVGFDKITCHIISSVPKIGMCTMFYFNDIHSMGRCLHRINCLYHISSIPFSSPFFLLLTEIVRKIEKPVVSIAPSSDIFLSNEVGEEEKKRSKRGNVIK